MEIDIYMILLFSYMKFISAVFFLIKGISPAQFLSRSFHQISLNVHFSCFNGILIFCHILMDSLKSLCYNNFLAYFVLFYDTERKISEILENAYYCCLFWILEEKKGWKYFNLNIMVFVAFMTDRFVDFVIHYKVTKIWTLLNIILQNVV